METDRGILHSYFVLGLTSLGDGRRAKGFTTPGAKQGKEVESESRFKQEKGKFLSIY